MKLKQFEFLVALKSNPSLSKVAEVMYMSQPAISISIKELEQELGFPVLKRTNRGVKFTDRGLLVLKQAEMIVRAVDNIKKLSAPSGGDSFTGSLRIGSLPHICNTIALNAQIELQGIYPGLKLDIIWDENQKLVDGVESGDLDLAIVQLCELDEKLLYQKVRQGKLKYGQLYRDRVCFAVSGTHPLASLPKVSPGDLLQYPYLQFRSCSNRYLAEFGREHNYPKRLIEINDMTGMRKQMPLTGAVTIMPELAIEHGNGCFLVQYVALNIDGVDWFTDVGWLHGPGAITRPMQAVISAIEKHCV